MRLLTALVALVAATGSTAVAQDIEPPPGFGAGKVTMIVPYAPGGGSDQVARAMASAMADVAGLDITVVTRPGGAGTAAVPEFMAAPEDGTTILEAIDDALTAHLTGVLPEDPAEDWVPICIAQITFSQIHTRTDDARFDDWDGFVAYARATPGATVAVVGNEGSLELITVAQIEEAFGIDVTPVQIEAADERYAALVDGDVDALLEQPGDVSAPVADGAMRPVLTLLAEHPAAFPDTPTHVEAGADFAPLMRYRGFFVKAGTPEPVVDYLEDVCRTAFDSDGFQTFNRAKFMDLVASYRDVDGALALIAETAATYREMYARIGLEAR